MPTSHKLTKAVIPAAGLGTRMWPLTRGAPKEMLLVGNRPIIHHVVQEAIDAGIKQICIVIRRGKESILRYFKESPPGRECEISFVYQTEPRGLGDALLCARQFVCADTFAMLLPDQLFMYQVAPVAQLINKKIPANSVIIGLSRIQPSEAQYFPRASSFICESDHSARPDVLMITGIEDTCRHSVRGIGRTIFPADVFRFLDENLANPLTGEVDLLMAYQALLK